MSIQNPTQLFSESIRRILFVGAFVASVIAFFTADVGGVRIVFRPAKDMVAQVVGVSAGVLPNEWNVVAQRLTQQSEALDERERIINEQEQALAERERQNTVATYLFTGIAFILLVLILINFYADWKRGTRNA
jgi:hypothetical protein